MHYFVINQRWFFLRNKERILLTHLLFSHLVTLNSTTPWAARLPCPSPSPRVCSSSCPLSPWCHHSTISSSVIPFSACPQSSPAWRPFLMRRLFTSCGQSIGCKEFSTMPGKKKGLLSVQFSRSIVSDSLQPHGQQHTGFPVHHQLLEFLKLRSIESVRPSNHLILCCPLLLLPSTFPSIRVFSKESVLRIRWPKYWSFSFSISPSNEYSGLISFRMDWLDLLAVQGTLKNLLQMLLFWLFSCKEPTGVESASREILHP